MRYLGTIAIIVITMPVVQSRAADILHLADDSTIVISADESWEDIDQGVLHFRGNFEIRTPAWRLRADQARIYGSLEDPKRVIADGIADGAPVQFFYRGNGIKDSDPTEGEGEHLEYDRENNLLILSGNAVLTSGSRVMHSQRIQYDLDNQQLDAGGSDGVQVTVDPDGTIK